MDYLGTDYAAGWAYTPAEWAAILAALPDGRRRVDEEVLQRQLVDLDHLIKGTRYEAPAQASRVASIQALIDACDMLLAAAATRARTEMAVRDITIDGADHLAHAVPALTAARDEFARGMALEREVLESLRQKGEEPVDMLVMKHSAQLWAFYGGVVDYGKDFDRFFEAVTGPIFRSMGARRLGIAWAANKKQRLIRAWTAPEAEQRKRRKARITKAKSPKL